VFVSGEILSYYPGRVKGESERKRVRTGSRAEAEEPFAEGDRELCRNRKIPPAKTAENAAKTGGKAGACLTKGRS
jgi:hypothetical protein